MLAVAEPLVHPAHDVARHRGEEFLTGRLVGMNVILEQLGVVVGHLLEVRDDPALIDRVAMEAAGELVIDAAARHFLQRGDENIAEFCVARANGMIHQQIERRRMRKFGRTSEAAIALVEHLPRRLDNRVNHFGRDISAVAGERLRLRDRAGDHVGLLDHFAMLFAIGLRDRQQHALEARAARS